MCESSYFETDELQNLFKYDAHKREFVKYTKSVDFECLLEKRCFLEELFRKSLANERLDVAKALLKSNPDLLDRLFAFLGKEGIKHLLKRGNEKLINYPVFSTESLGFDEVARNITFACSNGNPSKRVGKHFKEHGISGLNNLYLTCMAADGYIGLDEILSFYLDVIVWGEPSLSHFKLPKNYKKIFDYISPKRFIKIVSRMPFFLTTSIFEDMVDDFNEHYPLYGIEKEMKKFISSTRFELIHDMHSTCWDHAAILILQKKIVDPRALNQRYEVLQDVQVGSYRVDVPETNLDLVRISAKMKNCAYSYAKKVFRNEVNLITLNQGETPYYCAEIDVESGEIVQLKGRRNHELGSKNELVFKQKLQQMVSSIRDCLVQHWMLDKNCLYALLFV